MRMISVFSSAFASGMHSTYHTPWVLCSTNVFGSRDMPFGIGFHFNDAPNIFSSCTSVRPRACVQRELLIRGYSNLKELLHSAIAVFRERFIPGRRVMNVCGDLVAKNRGHVQTMDFRRFLEAVIRNNFGSRGVCGRAQ